MESKFELRKLYKLKRIQLGHEERHLLSDKVTENVLQFLLDKRHIRHIHIFLPIEKLHEINTISLIERLRQQDKEIYTSVSDFKRREMHTVRLSSDQQMKTDPNGITIPTNPEIVSNTLLQMLLIPLLAYDLKGHRLGYGKGFYDKFIVNLSQNVLKVGLSFFPPEKHIPTEKHDELLDYCINPEGIIKFPITMEADS